MNVISGIDLFIHDIRGQEEMPEKDDLMESIAIYFCTSGICEQTHEGGKGILLQDGGISVSRIDPSLQKDREYCFPTGRYQGVGLLIRPQVAEEWCRLHAPEFDLSFSELTESILGVKRARFGKASLECEHILRELYASGMHRPLMWTRLKVLELMMALKDGVIEYGQEYIPSDHVRMARHLRDHIIGLKAGEFSLEKIAEEHKMSVSQIQRIFKAVYGQSIYQYFKQYRLEEAAALLQNTDSSVEEIAYLAGYQSSGKFTAAFKAQFKVTPLAYRHQKTLA